MSDNLFNEFTKRFPADRSRTFLIERDGTERQTKNVRNRLAPYRRLQLHRPGRVKKSNAEHSEILDAISNGDAERAGRLMHQHVAVQGEALNDLLAIVPRGYLEPLAS